MSEPCPWIKETTAETFEADVIEASNTSLVVIDFWSPSCQPCKQLMLLLEQQARKQEGKLALIKVNVDEHQQLAAAFGVQSVPLVVAFRDGRPVDQFSGLLPEAEIAQWIQNLLPSEVEGLLQEALDSEAENPAAAEELFRKTIELEPEIAPLKINLARVLLAQDKDAECREIIEQLETREFLEPEAKTLKSQLELREAAEEAGGVQEARQTAEETPDDLSLQVNLADTLAVNRQFEEALEICLSVIERDKSGAGVAAKDTTLKIFDMLGPEAELTSTYRRRLATLLY